VNMSYSEGDRVRLLPGANDGVMGMSYYDPKLVDGAVVTVTHISESSGNVCVQADGSDDGEWYVLPEYLEKVPDHSAVIESLQAEIEEHEGWREIYEGNLKRAQKNAVEAQRSIDETDEKIAQFKAAIAALQAS